MRDSHFLPATDRERVNASIRRDQTLIAIVTMAGLLAILAITIGPRAAENWREARVAELPV